MDPTYLLTADAFVEYYNGLREDGILHINHHIYPRVVTTAALGWAQLGRSDFQRHVVVVMRHPLELDTLPTVLIKMTPWTASDMERLRDLYSLAAGQEAYYEIVEDPVEPHRSYLSPDFYSGRMSSATLESIPYRVVPTTDDRPYFKFFRRHLGLVSKDDATFVRGEVAHLLNLQIAQGGGLPLDVVHLIVTAAMSLVFAVVFVVIPMVFSRVGREPWSAKATTLLYFSALGAGFIILELTFIHKFWRFIGYPLYSYAVVLFTLLAGAGIGSFVSPRARVVPGGRWFLPFVGVLCCGAVFVLVHEWVFDVALGLATGWRIGVSILMLLPFGFFMGMAFPLGILFIEGRAGGRWLAWAMNGLFTVVGGLASVLLSIYLGFTATELIGLGIYGVAFAALWRLRAAGAVAA